MAGVIKVFTKFLEKQYLTKNYESIDDILELPIRSFKFLDRNAVKFLNEKLEIIKISDAAKLNKENPIKSYVELTQKEKDINPEEVKNSLELKYEIYKNNFPGIENNIKKAITISTLMTDINEESADLDNETQKIVVVGLDNAGKTAIITKVGKKTGISDLAKLQPTKGVNRQKIEGSNLDLLIWDFGGQEKYREKYLKDPEKYFLQIDLLMYVIDVQDSERFDETFDYFDKIIEILDTLEEKPHILIFIHKFDPDIADDPKILLNVELLKERINEIFQKRKISLEYETYATSIYSSFSREPEFSKHVKKVINAQFSLTDPHIRKVEALGKTLEETMNAVIRLSESLTQDLNEIDARLNAIESGAFHIAQSGVPLEIRSSDQIRETSETNVRSDVLNELKDLFAKKKRLEQ